MTFKFTRSTADDFYSHVRPEVRALAERAQRLTWDEWQKVRGNSYEFRLLVANLDDDALCKLYDHYVKNCFSSGRPLLRYELVRHYDDAIGRELAPLLATRLRALVTCPTCEGAREPGVHHACAGRRVS